jgi:hypothetical protein
MHRQEPSAAFDQAHAAIYDQRFAELAAMRDALHLLTSAVFADLTADARILCVGAGTAAELIYLAQKFPQWRFTAVEPSSPDLPDSCLVCEARLLSRKHQRRGGGSRNIEPILKIRMDGCCGARNDAAVGE